MRQTDQATETSSKHGSFNDTTNDKHRPCNLSKRNPRGESDQGREHHRWS